MQQKLMGTVAAVAIVTALYGPASAADLARKAPPPAPAPVVAPACMWCGFYFGGHLGYGWSKYNSLVSNPEDFAALGTDIASGPKGLALGFQTGYNWQFNQWVLGIESDASITPWEKNLPGQSAAYIHRRVDWLSTVRGRLGFAFDRSLIYATGGAAWVGASTQKQASSIPSAASFNGKAGWVAGGGWEYKVNPNISWRVEALYYGFNKTQTSVVPGSTSILLQEQLKSVTVVRGGVSWYFN